MRSTPDTDCCGQIQAAGRDGCDRYIFLSARSEHTGEGANRQRRIAYADPLPPPPCRRAEYKYRCALRQNLILGDKISPCFLDLKHVRGLLRPS
ncbi:hypothetical protein J6590_044827 [Homalodisca vitripennis]|nr:hypothetical protein J6590_044827 [Homalodisca vitripennis]